MKKSVLIINPYLHVGGVEKALISLLRALPRDKYHISLMLVKSEGEFLQYVPDDVRIVPCPLRKDIEDSEEQDFKAILEKLIHRKKIIAAIRWILAFVLMDKFHNDTLFCDFIGANKPGVNKHYDYIFNFCGPNNYTSALSESILSCDKKYIWIHNEFKAAEKSALKYAYRYKKYNGIFAVSQSCLDEFVELLPEMKSKTHLLYNITDANFYYEMADGRSSFEDNFDGIRLLSVGRLNKQKGFDLAIEVARQLKKEGLDFKWYIVGQGEEKNNLERLIEQYSLSDNVLLLGVRANPYPYFRDCDIYVQPSRYEGYGLTIAEAKAFHKPIVCTNFAGALDQLEDHVTGIITECSVPALTEAVIEMISNIELRTRLARNLRSKSVNTLPELDKLEEYLNAK